MEGDPESKPPAEWTVKYWQWIYSKPKCENPLKTGEVNNLEFLCLPCTGGGEDCGRVLNLENDDLTKDILVPVFASEYSTAEVQDCSDQQLRDKARAMSTPIQMEICVDGKPLIPHYVETEPFYITVPSNHMLDNEHAPPGKYRAISCGYWLKLKPLTAGKHMVEFGGLGENGFYTRVTYQINVPDDKNTLPE
jgi:hypothetical protein